MVPSSDYYIDEGTTITFTLFNLLNPSSAGKFTGLGIKIYDQDNLYMNLETA